MTYDGAMSTNNHSSIIDELKLIDPNALHVVRTVLEARAGSVMTHTSNLELRAELARTYALLSRLIDAVRNEVSDDEITAVTHFQHGEQA